MKTQWDYTDRASTYDKRADYNKKLITFLLNQIDCDLEKPVADIGAGTGKLTTLLLNYGLKVIAIEPNQNMRKYGINNTKSKKVSWYEGTGEQTGLGDSSVSAAFFGSSFNVVDQKKTLSEVSRILIPSGKFVCLWNHRDLSDLIQKQIEEVIKTFIPNYNYGSRRKDPTEVINNSGLFSTVNKLEDRFIVSMRKTDIIDAWKSHDTLFRQSNGKFDQIINSISELLSEEVYDVPYVTRIWFSEKAKILNSPAN